MLDEYIGEYLTQDVRAFCSSDDEYWNEDALLLQFKSIENKYLCFHWPILFLGGIWFAYKGLMKTAVKIDLLKWGLQFLCMAICRLNDWYKFEIWAVLIITLIYQAFIAGVGPEIYWKHIRLCLDKRGLKGRSPIECNELKKSLCEEGKSSAKRAIHYVIFFSFLTKLCVEDLLTTLYWTLEDVFVTLQQIFSLTLE